MLSRLCRATAYTFALTCVASTASAHFETGQIWIVDQLNNRLYFVNPTSFNVSISALAAPLAGPSAIGFSLHGDMIIANFASNNVFNVEGDLSYQTVLTSDDGINGPFGGNGIAIGPGHGDIYITNYASSEIVQYDENYLNGVVFANAADGLISPGGMAFLADGDMLIADRGISRGTVLVAEHDGTVSNFWSPPNLERPISIAIRKNRDVYVLMVSGKIYRLIGGDPMNAVVLGTYGTSALRGSIAFHQDYNSLYHVNQVDGDLRLIDADLGTDTIVAVLPAGGGGTSMIVAGTQYAPGTMIEYGLPLAGSGGISPTYHGLGDLRLGQPFTLQAHNFLGGSQIFMFLGIAAEESVFLGGEFHIDTSAFYKLLIRTTSGPVGVPGAGEFDFNFVMPNDPSLVYISLYSQVLGTDPGAPMGASFSPCLELYIGE